MTTAPINTFEQFMEKVSVQRVLMHPTKKFDELGQVCYKSVTITAEELSLGGVLTDYIKTASDECIKMLFCAVCAVKAHQVDYEIKVLRETFEHLATYSPPQDLLTRLGHFTEFIPLYEDSLSYLSDLIDVYGGQNNV